MHALTMKRTAESLIHELRRLREHERIEAKRGYGKEALHTIVAFANEPGMRGGWLLIGVSSPDYAVVGVDDPERVTEQITSQCSDDTLSRPIRPHVYTEEVEGRRVVVAYVPEASAGEKPVYMTRLGLPRGAYRRIGSSDVEGVDTDLDRYREAASGPYENTIVEDAEVAHIDGSIVREYLAELKVASPDSELLGFTADEVVEALGGLRRAPDGTLRPTVAGLLLFGTRVALRRFLPVASRIDYLRIDGTDWVPDDERPFENVVEIREPLLLAFKRTYRAVLDDLGTTFSFDAASAQRDEDSQIPRRVIREALVNALTHRNFRLQSTVQILRFRDRLEIRNPGHSLVDEDDFGKPGSQTRNPHLVQFFHDLRLAENKGTGIRVMRDRMRRAKLTPPLFDSDRKNDRFAATFLFHHLIGDAEREWLTQFGSYGLSDEQAVALAYARRLGAVRNQSLRDILGLDTLAASAQLRRLRDMGLIEPKGSGSATRYELTARARADAAAPGSAVSEAQPQLVLAGLDKLDGGGALKGKVPDDLKGKAPGVKGKAPGAKGKAPGSHEPVHFSSELERDIDALGQRASPERLRDIIERMCGERELTAGEIAGRLARKHVRHLVERHLGPMVESGRLERTQPGTPFHPQQGYRRGPGGERRPGST